MKKSTLNRILLGIIAFLTVSICVLLILISTRPHYISTDEKPTAIIEEVSLPEQIQNTQDTVPTEEVTPPKNVASLRGKTSTKVNIRERDNTDARVLKVVDEGFEFDIIEIQQNGWTKIKYDNSYAYISSTFVILLQ